MVLGKAILVKEQNAVGPGCKGSQRYTWGQVARDHRGIHGARLQGITEVYMGPGCKGSQRYTWRQVARDQRGIHGARLQGIREVNMGPGCKGSQRYTWG